MIPKIIHYCWFGRGEKPKLAKKCIASWKKYMPDYEIIEWNEDNFDFDYHPYLRWCYENKKWAYLSDFARLIVVERHGGIYFDTDVEAIRDFKDILKFSAFYGFENDDYIDTGLGFGAEAHHISVQHMVERYSLKVAQDDGSFALEGCPILNTAALDSLGLIHDGRFQILEGAAVFPIDYFNPYDDHTGRINKTHNSHSIHWYAKSALPKSAILRSNITRPLHRIFGKNCFSWIKDLIREKV